MRKLSDKNRKRLKSLGLVALTYSHQLQGCICLGSGGSTPLPKIADLLLMFINRFRGSILASPCGPSWMQSPALWATFYQMLVHNCGTVPVRMSEPKILTVIAADDGPVRGRTGSRRPVWHLGQQQTSTHSSLWNPKIFERFPITTVLKKSNSLK